MDVLEERVDQFNRQYIWQAAEGVQEPSHTVDGDGFDDIEAFAELVHEGYDIVNNLTLDLT